MKNTYVTTEAHTCNKSIFYVFERIELDYDTNKSITNKILDEDELNNLVGIELPPWMKWKNDIHRTYSSIRVISLNTNFAIRNICKYLQGFTLNTNEKLSSYFLEEEFRHYILYDVKLNTFTYVIEIPFKLIPSKNGTIYVSNNKGESVTYYNCVRDCIIVNTTDEMPIYAMEARREIQKTIREFMDKVYNYRKATLCMYPNAGNITVVTRVDDIKKAQSYVETNHNSERSAYTNEVFESDSCVYSLNGRFHSVITTLDKYQYHYLPITFEAQYVWGYLNTIRTIINEYNMLRIKSEGLKIDQNEIVLMRRLLEKVDILIYEYEDFKSTIENDYQTVLRHFEIAWKINMNMLAAREYLDKINVNIERIQRERGERIGIKQNKILFIISITQIFAFLSVWLDFLAWRNEFGMGGLVTETGNYIITNISYVIPYLLSILVIAISLISYNKRFD